MEGAVIMSSPDVLEVVVIVIGTVVLLAILFGPSLYSSYQNWRLGKDK